MSAPLILAHPEATRLTAALCSRLDAELGELQLRRFPDGESFVRVLSPVQGRDVILAWPLDHPDAHSVALYLLACALREQGAARIILAAPYLAYMRQDFAFHPGEAVSARHYARWLSSFLDGLVTLDPHLHRIHHLDEVYSIPSRVVAAAPALAEWIAGHVDKPLLIGPDEESEQWVADVATRVGAPHRVLSKERRGDREVEVSVPDVAAHLDCTPVLVDDIISTGRTMLAALHHLREAGLRPALCVGVHALFAGDAYQALLAARPADIVTCNTIAHPSNRIDIAALLADGVGRLLEDL